MCELEDSSPSEPLCACPPSLEKQQKDHRCIACQHWVPVCMCSPSSPTTRKTYNSNHVCFKCLKFVYDWVQPVMLPRIIPQEVAVPLYKRLTTLFPGNPLYDIRWLAPQDLPELAPIVETALQRVATVRERFRAQFATIAVNWMRDETSWREPHSHPASETLLFVLREQSPPAMKDLTNAPLCGSSETKDRPLVIADKEYPLSSGDGIYFSTEEHGVPKVDYPQGPRISIVYFYNGGGWGDDSCDDQEK